MRKTILSIAAMLAIGMFFSLSATAEDRTEAEDCAACHFAPHMAWVVDTYYDSSHAMSFGSPQANTYCAKCHSPFQADPDASYGNKEPVPQDEWEAVTCGSCHPPHDLRVEWGTPIGNYDIAAADWSPLYDANELCVSCHTGSRHTGPDEFKGYGDVMFHKKDVGCIDCHMAKVPTDYDPEERRHTHTFDVGANLPYSCGVGPGGCHSNHKEEWAAKQILKNKIHGK